MFPAGLLPSFEQQSRSPTAAHADLLQIPKGMLYNQFETTRRRKSGPARIADLEVLDGSALPQRETPGGRLGQIGVPGFVHRLGSDMD